MATYGISGVWKDRDGVITHYAVHTKAANGDSYSRAAKKTKAQAIALLEVIGSIAYTWVWSYTRSDWQDGEKVQVVSNGTRKYLRSNADDKLTDNLAHLIDFDWILP